MTTTTPADFVVAIPARYASTRLPGKPLQLIGGRPMIQHVAERALLAGAREVWVATDDARIAEVIEGLSGVHVAMTGNEHVSGTDRLAECARIAGWEAETCVVNLQGDEPFAPAAGIRAVAELLLHSGAEMATLAAQVDSAHELFDRTWSSWCVAQVATPCTSAARRFLASRQLRQSARQLAQ